MTWLDAPGFPRRPVVFVEDHLYHTADMLSAVAAARPDLLREMTVCVVDRGGPDTAAGVADWLRMYPDLQIAAPVRVVERVTSLAQADLLDAPAFARFVARLLRPGGVLVQDVQLTTLPFVPADRWWESIYVAATLRGMFGDRPPAVRFLSNKRGYAATFGRDLAEAGFDPRDVMDKADLAAAVIPTVAALFDRGFPLRLECAPAASRISTWRVADHQAERQEIDGALDLTVWISADGVELGGRLIAGSPDKHLALKASAPETQTWIALVEDRLTGGAGLPVSGVGARIGPQKAERAELSNLAARHIHTLRGRLQDPAAIVTAEHAYRLADRLRVGRISAPTSSHLR